MSESENSNDVGGSQGNAAKKRDERRRSFAFVVYPESVAEGWIESLKAEHVEGFVSPLHDADVDADGRLKKEHRHGLLAFEGKKSKAQIRALLDRCLGESWGAHIESVESYRAYARYLIHMDDPDKAQYRREDVIALGPADYDMVCAMPADDTRAMRDIVKYIEQHRITSLVRFASMVSDSHPEWFAMLVHRRSYLITSLISSMAETVRREEDARLRDLAGY